MKHYINRTTNEIFAYEEDGSQDYLIAAELEALTDEELTILRTPVPEPVIEPVVIASVSPRQIRQALTRAGLRDAVEAAVAAGDQDTKDWWEFSTAFERLNPVVVSMGLSLAVTEEQLDQLWALAASL